MSIDWKRWDNGAAWHDWSTKGDGRLTLAELERGGGVAAFVVELRRLDPAAQRDVLARLDAPARDAIETHYDSALREVVRRFDRGHKPWWAMGLPVGRDNWNLTPDEVDGVGRAEFLSAVAALRPEQRTRLSTNLDPELVEALGVDLPAVAPDLFAPLDFGRLYADRAQRREGERARRLVTKMGLLPDTLTGGLTAAALASVPAVPATAEEQLASDLRATLSGGGAIGPLELMRAAAEHGYPRKPQLEAGSFGPALAANPERFAGIDIELTGHAVEAGTRLYSYTATTTVYNAALKQAIPQTTKRWATGRLYRLYGNASGTGPFVEVVARSGKELAPQLVRVSGRVREHPERSFHVLLDP